MKNRAKLPTSLSKVLNQGLYFHFQSVMLLFNLWSLEPYQAKLTRNLHLSVCLDVQAP
jgi:hypothetical protein